jgi:hypothetical protein
MIKAFWEDRVRFAGVTALERVLGTDGVSITGELFLLTGVTLFFSSGDGDRFLLDSTTG